MVAPWSAYRVSLVSTALPLGKMAYVLGYGCQGATVFTQRMNSVPNFSFESPELILFS